MQIDQSITFADTIKYRGLQLTQIMQTQVHKYSITCNLSKQIIELVPNKFYPLSVQVYGNCVYLSNFVLLTNENQGISQLSKSLPLVIDDNQGGPYQQILSKSYKCYLHKQSNTIKLQIKDVNSFKLCYEQVDRPKFACTKKLEKILAGEYTDSAGILTMDQSGRFIVQKNQCKFPAIGLWVNCSNIEDFIVTSKIYSFLHRKASKTFSKYLLEFNNEYYISFAKINPQTLPQLYLVSWKLQKSEQIKQRFCDISINKNQNLTIVFNEQNLQFTLSGKQTVSSFKVSQFSSPYKDAINSQLQQQLQKLHLQQSPQFSSVKKTNQWGTWQEERTYLKNIIQCQQTQIYRLNNQIIQINKQLSNLRKCVTSPPHKNLNNFHSPLQLNNTNSPTQKQKNLSESDLKCCSNLKSFESGGTGTTLERKSLQGQSLQSQNSLQKRKTKQLEGEQDPWDLIQLIE